MECEDRIVQNENRRPVRFGIALGRAMIKSDSRLEMKWGDDRSFRRLVEKVPRAADQALVPLGPILVLHEQD